MLPHARVSGGVRSGERWPRIPLPAYLAALPVSRRLVAFRAEDDLRLPAFRGALWHSVIGRALKEAVCVVPPGLCGACPRREVCEYPAVMESRSASAAEGPLGRGARVPGPLIIEPGTWEPRQVPAGELFRLDFAFAGRDGRALTAVEHAIREGARRGLGRRRARARAVRLESREPLAGVMARCSTAAPASVVLRLVSPLRLKRDGRYLRQFDLPALARDLSFRVAALGAYQGGLPWPAPWEEVREQAARASVREARTRWTEGVRYSARQEREIVLGGLVGEVSIEGAGPELVQLLAAGTVLHAGKGASMGLGQIELVSEETAVRTLEENDEHDGRAADHPPIHHAGVPR
jgi:hypothetical protein